MDRRGLAWALGGVVPIMLVGSLLHFAFDWSNQWTPIAVVAAVNESVWEHLKLAFWPMLGWALIERRFLDTPPGAFWAAKSIGVLVASVSIVVVFFTYVAVLGRNVLILDLATYGLSVTLGQVAAAALVSAASVRPILRRAALLLLAVQIVAFSTLTYLPPQWELFRDPRNGSHKMRAGWKETSIHEVEPVQVVIRRFSDPEPANDGPVRRKVITLTPNDLKVL